MSEKNITRNSTEQKKGNGGFVIRVLFFALFAVGLLGSIGMFGGAVKAFFTGVFGFMSYAVFSIALFLMILFRFEKVQKAVSARSVVFAFFLALIFLTYLQIVTSHKEFSELEIKGFSAYLSACYEVGLGTSGGWLIGLIAYPLLSMMGKYSAIVMAVLFFIVLFFALLPMMRGAAKKETSSEQKETRRTSAPAPSGEKKGGDVSLFVDKVRPGQKDAQKIKKKGWFARKGPDPEFFDYRDTRPLYAPEGIVPEATHERFDRYVTDEAASQRNVPFADIPVFESEPPTSPRVYPDPVEDKSEDYSRDDMPAFVRRYAGERAEAKRRLYGDDTLNEIPEEPRFDRKEEGKSELSVGTAPAPVVESPASRPKPRLDGIITDMSDLKRIKAEENAAPTRETFIGENPIAPVSPAPSVDAPLAQKPPMSPVLEDSITEDVVEEYVAEEDVDLPPIPPVSAPIPPRESVAKSESTITPRDASGSEPVEAKPKIVFEPPVPKMQPIVEEEPQPEERTSLRKPRSDIGGTHRTSDPKPNNGFIPPQKMEQMEISQVEEPKEEPPARPFTAPPVNLLTEYPAIQDEEGVDDRGKTLVDALASFNIKSELVDHKTGPTFTQYAVTLPDNMSVNKLISIEKDIKRKLRVEKNIRIIPSVPGLDAVGIEVANQNTSTIGLRSIISSPVFEKEGKLYFAIGVDVSGRAVYGDLLKMPHLLVAGSTGSGKSVCLNVLICSIMYHYSPEIVRFIMIDPKTVELSIYKNMPHMLMPSTVTEAPKAVNALNWAVNEMERRYQLLNENGCRNVGEYNTLMKKKGGKKLYYLVLIVDEMADLMYTVKREIEDKINRLAAKARAAGIHLIVATQRPSVDVITGTIKNNFPTRIAFKVTSFTDSKTILDRGGAESLFGNGDMLYMPPEGGDPVRLQGPFITIDEITDIVEFIKKHNDSRFDSDVERIIQADKEATVEAPKNDGEGGEDDGEDPFFAPALLYFINIGQASISKLQIKYHIGYGRAARIVETMSERGYLGPAEAGNKSRQVIITLDEYYELYGEDGIDGDEAK